MRYYAVALKNPDGSKTAVGPFPGESQQFTSYRNGKTLPGALNIELDLPLNNWDEPMGGGFIRIWGVGITDIKQASNLNGCSIDVFGGMAKGLPLANPSQSGLLVSGVVQQAFGNWQGTQQSIDLLIQGNYGTPSSPANIVFQCATGGSIAIAAIRAIESGFPSAQIESSLPDTMVVPYDVQTCYFASLGQFATFLAQLTRNVVNGPASDGTYQGAKITVQDGVFIIYDGTATTSPLQIDFKDLIGQPTWIGFGTIQFKAVMRADIQVGDFIKLPPGQQTILAQSYSQYRKGSVFQGVFQVARIRHMGNFRQRDANSWVTVIDGVISDEVSGT